MCEETKCKFKNQCMENERMNSEVLNSDLVEHVERGEKNSC